MSDKKSEKRRDTKNRILNTGESQRGNGLYVFKYVVNGKPKFAYSWRLVETERLPKGKRPCKPLRDPSFMPSSPVAVRTCVKVP